MNRDHVLFLLVGLLGGFLAGYMAHEAVVGVQPARVAASEAAAAGPAGAAPAPSVPSASGAAGGNAPVMAEVRELESRLEKDPKDADALLKLANLNFDIQRWPRATDLYQRYLALRPDDADALTDLGITLRAQGQFDRALASFRAAQKIKPDHWQARFNEIVVLGFDQRDLPAAESALAELEKRSPGNADVARLADELKRLKETGG
jgi:tetratricopeptide (TPR) repeat protein